MKISARNAFAGSITALVDGQVNAEVEVTTPGGDRIVAIVTEGSVQALGLAVGKPVVAYVKAPWVMVLAGTGGVKFSARNQLAGTVESLQKGAVNSDIGIRLAGGALSFCHDCSPYSAMQRPTPSGISTRYCEIRTRGGYAVSSGSF